MKERITKFNHLDWQCDLAEVRSNGRRKIGSLFFETIRPAQFKKYPPVYTLQETDAWVPTWDIWVPSAKLIYILSDSEYEAAMKLVDSIEHWEMLIANDWFIHGIDKDYRWTGVGQWRQEQQARKQSVGESALLKMAQDGNVAAAKALMSIGSVRGRPTKRRDRDWETNR